MAAALNFLWNEWVNTEDRKIEICLKEAKEYLSDVEWMLVPPLLCSRSSGGRHTTTKTTTTSWHPELNKKDKKGDQAGTKI